MFFTRLFSIILLSTFACGAANYEEKARFFLDTLTMNGKLPIHKDLRELLEGIKNCKNRESIIDGIINFHSTPQNDLESASDARAVYFFSKTVMESFLFRVIKELNCWPEDLSNELIKNGLEESEELLKLKPKLEKVTGNEFEKRAKEKYSQDDLNKIIFSESTKMTTAILNVLANR
jgi:hypothetical protein